MKQQGYYHWQTIKLQLNSLGAVDELAKKITKTRFYYNSFPFLSTKCELEVDSPKSPSPKKILKKKIRNLIFNIILLFTVHRIYSATLELFAILCQ